MITKRLQHAGQFARRPADEARERGIRLRVAFKGLSETLNQVEPHRDAAACAKARGGALAPAAVTIERHGKRARSR